MKIDIKKTRKPRWSLPSPISISLFISLSILFSNSLRFLCHFFFRHYLNFSKYIFKDLPLSFLFHLSLFLSFNLLMMSLLQIHSLLMKFCKNTKKK